MRSALMIVVVIAMLIVGILVVKNLGPDYSDDKYEAEKTKIVENTKDTAKIVENKMKKIKNSLKRSVEPQ